MDSMFQVLAILVKGLGENIKKNMLAIHHSGTDGTEKGLSLLGRRKSAFRANLQPLRAGDGAMPRSVARASFLSIRNRH
jgi:hypothetical protein